MLNIGLEVQKKDTVNTYTVRHESGCTLIFGSIPIDDFVALTKTASKTDVPDTQLAMVAGASVVFGPAEACQELKARYAQERAVALATAYPELPHAAITWVAHGEHGLSSLAIFRRMTGVVPYPIGAGNESAHPHDARDLRRCRLLLEQVPEWQARLAEMREVSPEWDRLVEAWDAMCETMDTEAPDWRTYAQGSGVCAKWAAIFEIMDAAMEGSGAPVAGCNQEG